VSQTILSRRRARARRKRKFSVRENTVSALVRPLPESAVLDIEQTANGIYLFIRFEAFRMAFVTGSRENRCSCRACERRRFPHSFGNRRVQSSAAARAICKSHATFPLRGDGELVYEQRARTRIYDARARVELRRINGERASGRERESARVTGKNIKSLSGRLLRSFRVTARRMGGTRDPGDSLCSHYYTVQIELRAGEYNIHYCCCCCCCCCCWCVQVK